MWSSAGPKPVGKATEVSFVDGVEHDDGWRPGRFCLREPRSLTGAACRLPLVCTSGETVAGDTLLVGPVCADRRAGARDLPRSPPTSCHPLREQPYA
ncbi:hypothetical protein M2202_001294 [Bradyrhizobium japonicum]|nr:hypothetical protein [Bradyrhizobium japonicum]MCP1804539.1 hypothetical protein [Bradyrhizobium japonicum]MCP1813561.1 hypothetical protein [Bradyrhizobium japonicum]MCP1875019.1 hypothetical protein [Bradyrhizobium japonicum]MCP1946277.1 hypothetical protein [Bradyrhizobium japonicum]